MSTFLLLHSPGTNHVLWPAGPQPWAHHVLWPAGPWAFPVSHLGFQVSIFFGVFNLKWIWELQTKAN